MRGRRSWTERRYGWRWFGALVWRSILGALLLAGLVLLMLAWWWLASGF